MHIEIINPFYSAGMRDYVAVPVPDGDEFRLVSDDGEILATAYRHADSGRYTVTQEIAGDTLLYQSWQLALAEQSGMSVAEIESAISEDDDDEDGYSQYDDPDGYSRNGAFDGFQITSDAEGGL